MSKQQKEFKRKLVRYDRSFFANIPAKLIRANNPIIKLSLTIDKVKKLIKIQDNTR